MNSRPHPAPDTYASSVENSAHQITAAVAGSGFAVGSRIVSPEEIDRAFRMPVGKLRSRAGIESLAYAADEQTELTMGAAALNDALKAAECESAQIGAVIATSETHREYPSLAAQLHRCVGLAENCAAFDVGGACLGLLNALAIGQSLIESGQAANVAIVTADLHSRVLTPQRVAGEFGGLFGDGASAFVLRASQPGQRRKACRLGKFFFGSANQYAEAIRVRDDSAGGLKVQFDGEALSRAAITRMERVLKQVECASGIPRAGVGDFATHQPNPRLVTLLAKQCGVPAAKFPSVAVKFGNLGSSTCGVALHMALQSAPNSGATGRKPIFLASLGPGLLFGGGWLEQPNAQGSELEL
jgi:3-oxoacyl-[acyl-carrier-protein] synthase-3